MYSQKSLNGQVCALFQGRLAEKRLRLHVTKPSVDEMAVQGDSNRLCQVQDLSSIKVLEVFSSICADYLLT
jgi:hypothetical protein